MDQAVWAIWYDLQDQTQSVYIDWLHKEYLPILQSRPGFTWAAHYQSQGGGADMEKVRNTFPKSHGMEGLGKGTQFLMLVGATEPWVLLDPSVIHEERAITGKVKEMLNMRQNTRSCIFSVFARVNGPEMNKRPLGTTPAPAIQMGSFRINELENEYDVGAWYAQQRLPAMAKMPGCIGARVMLSIAGWAKYSVLYEFTSLETRLKYFEKPLESLMLDEQEWSGKIVRSTMHTPGSPTIARRIWPAVPVEDE